MGHNSLQVCMDSSDWLQGTIHEESPMESSSPLSGEMLTCSRPLMERRLRPQHDQALKCPRCDSTHTKFCYYNNYSLSQPRYFCKTCRRYWTKGGTLRNIPVGGGCRKNKKVSSKKPNENNHNNSHEHQSPLMSHHNGGGGGGGSSASSIMSSHHNPTDLHLSFHPDHHHHHHQMQFSHLNNLMLGSSSNPSNPSFMDRYSGILENSNNSRPIDFMESKLEAIVGNGRNNNNFDFMGSSADHLGIMGGLGSNMGTGSSGGAHGLVVDQPSFHHPFGMMSSSSSSFDGQNGNFMDTCQRLMLPYDHQHQAHHEDLDQDHHHHDHHQNGMDVKPNAKLLSLEWQDHGNKESFGYLNGLGSSWNNVMNNYGPPTTNSLV